MRHFPFSYQMIRSAVYNLAEKTLEIEFKDGSSKRLRDITPQIYAHLMNRSLCEKALSKFSQKLATK
ncbi:MAG: KTSC domain-containing protein [Flexibacter sp. CG_4_10_14_3_um_filter_32_15]|nr:MAG: KTSC domain-containing protein [Flexibacter sp. CG_4_10_14_3_um_filter_32_15]